MLVGVVARSRRQLDEAAERKIEASGLEDHAVDEVRVAGAAVRLEVGEKRVRVGMRPMLYVNEGLHRDGARLDPERIAQRAVRIRKSVEQVRVGVVAGAGQNLAVRGPNVELAY